MIKIKRIYHRGEHFISSFHTGTGSYVRTAVLKGEREGKDPFQADFPELIDIGIMGHCIHGKKGLCLKAGIGCYQDGLHAKKKNMSLELFQRIADECQGRTFQFALGGAGDPDQHEQFEEILRYSRAKGIVPNFTTSGYGLTEELAEISGKYCGAVAVSWYRSPYTWRAVELLLAEKVTTNIHYVLGRDSIEEAVSRLKHRDFPEGINGVVFLLHKPVGLGRAGQVLSPEDGRLKVFFKQVEEEDFPFRIGFDSCMIPGVVNYTKKLDVNSMDTCEGGRFSCYITSDGNMLPCSFDNQEQRWAYDLSKGTIEEGWNSQAFEDFRRILKEACPGCGIRDLCMGGCPIRPEIVLCIKKGRDGMKYRTGFVTNSSSVSFYVGKKEDRKLTIDDAFALLKECWNDYYDCAERLIQHILASEKKEVRELVRLGTEREIWGEDIWLDNSLAWLTDTKIYVDFNDCYPEKKELLEALAKEFGIHPDDMEILTPYDLEKNQVVRKPWLTAGNWEEAEKLGIGRDDIQIFVLGDETYRAGILAYQRKEALSERDFETLDAYYEALDNIQGDTPPIDFDLQLGLGNMDFVEDEKQKACRECQVIVETWDSNIPIGVYNRMKARSLGAVYHGC